MTGAEQIAAERERQVNEEGWTPEHDDGHGFGEMATAAECYLSAVYEISRGAPPDVIEQSMPPRLWPWEGNWWKPHQDPVRNLVKAGALIAAEIDRIQRSRKL